jgi:hypothetical protein
MKKIAFCHGRSSEQDSKYPVNNMMMILILTDRFTCIT